MNRNYKVIWNRSLNCFMAVAEYAKSRGKSSGIVSSASTASAAVSSGTRLLRLSALSVGLVAAGLSVSPQVFAAPYSVGGGSAVGTDAIAIGNLATTANTATNAQSIAIGAETKATGDQSVALGANVVASGNSSVAVGGDDVDKIANNATQAAQYTAITGGTLTAGNYTPTTASGAGASAFGVKSVASGDFSSAIGMTSSAAGAASVALGVSSNASGQGALAIGPVSTASNSGSVAVGINSRSTGANAIAIGSGNTATTGANSTATNSVAIGASANASVANSVALGAGSTTTAQTGNAFLTNTAPSATNGVVSVGSSTVTRRIQNVAGGSAATDAVNVAQLTAQNTLTNKQGADTAAALGGTSTYNPTTGAVSAPVYSVGGTTVNNVGAAITNIDGRTTTNATNIATVQAQANQGFNIKAGSSAVDNVKLGETVAFTNTDNNLVVTNNSADNTVNYNLAQNLDLGTAGSLKTGNTLTNDAGVRVANGTNVTAVTAAGTSVTNGTRTSNYGADGLVATDTFGNRRGFYNAYDMTLSNANGTNQTTADSNFLSNKTGINVSTADYSAIYSADGNNNISTANNNTIRNGNDVTTTSATGTNVTDGTNTSNYGTNGLTATDGTNTTILNTAGLSFTDANGATGPSITAAGIDAANTKITGVAAGTATTDAVNVGQLTTTNTKTDALGASTATNLGGGATYNATTGAVSAPAYSLNNGTVTATTVGGALTNLDGRTTTNTANIAKGFNISAAGGTPDNVQLGETVNFTSNDKNLVVTNNGANGINYDLADNIVVNKVTAGDSTFNSAGVTITDGPKNTVTLSGSGLNNGGNRITGLANGIATDDAATFGQLSTTNAAVTDAGNIAAGNLAALGGGAAYNATDNTYTAPTYTLNNGATSFNTVDGALSNLDGRTTTNTGDIANVQAQANKGFNISAAGGTKNNVQLGETVDFTNTDGNLVVTASTNGINYNLAKNIDLDTTGSLKTGNTVTNNAGVRVANGTNTSNYGANGLVATDIFGNSSNYSAGSNIVSNGSSVNINTATASYINDSIGNLNFSTATNNVISKGTNRTTTSATGTNVTDGTNTSNYGANGLTATDGTNTTTLNKTGLSFTDANGATGPSITAAGINAGGQVLTNVGAGSITTTSKDAINGSQLFGSVESVKNVIGGNAVNTAGVVTSTDIGGTGANTIDGAITNVRDAATKAKTTVTEGKNVTVTTSTNADGSINYEVKTKDDLALTSVTAGNSVLNNAGLTITGGPSVTTAGINAAGTKVTGVAAGTAATDAVNVGQLKTAGTAVNNKINALGTSTATNLGGGAKYNTATGTVGAPTYTLDNGTNTGTTADFNNVGSALDNLNTRTTTNTGDIADLASGKTGLVRQDNGTGVITVGAATGGTSVNFANSTGADRQLTGVASAGDYTVDANANNAVNAGDLNTAVNSVTDLGLSFAGDSGKNVQRKLGETLNVTGGANTATLTENNIGVVTNDTNGLIVKLNKDIDLGADGSLKTGNTVTNNAGVTITDGANITAVTSAGTNVTDGTSNSNYGANGFTATDGNGNTGSYNAASTVLTDDSGNINASAAIGNVIRDASGNTNVSGAIGNAVFDNQGNANLSGARGSVIFDNAGNRTITSATGTNVTDGTNTSNYGANGLTATDAAGNSTLVNQAGLSFTDVNGTATGPSITAAGINAGNSTISNVADGVAASDVATFGQLTAANATAGAKTDALGTSTATNLGGTATYDEVTGTVSAPVYTLDDGTNKGTNVTANNVGGALDNLNTRTTTNTGDIANVQAQANKGFNISAAGGTANNVQLGETVDFTNTDGNLVATASANGINYNLAENIDLGKDGSIRTGNTTVNNAGITILNGTVDTVTLGRNGLNNGGNRITNLAAGVVADDAATFGQVTDVNNKVNTLGTSTASNLGGNAKYNAATGAVSAPTYTLDNGTNTGTTADFNNVGSALDNLNTRTTTNTGDIADLASGKTGLVRQDNGTGIITVGATTGGTVVDFANSTGVTRQLTGVASAGDYTIADNANNAVNAGDLNTAVNSVTDLGLSFAGDSGKNVQRKLGETLNVTGGETNPAALASGNNIGVSTNATNNGLLVQLAKDIDLGATGSLKTGNAVTNNAGVTITDGANITAVRATGTNVTDGINTSNYGANGLTIAGGPSVTATGINAAGNKVSNVANGTDDGDAVNLGQLTAANATAGAKTDALGTSTANNLGGGATYNTKNGTVSAPTYTLNDGTNTGTNTTVNTVSDALGNLDGRTTTNTSNIANVQAQANRGINVGNGSTSNNFALGDTINVNGDNNLTSTTTADGVQVTLNKQVDLGSTGSFTAGNSVLNNTGLTIAGGPSVTATGINAAGNKVSNIADGTVAGDAVNLGQLTAANATAGAKTDALGNSTAANLGGNATYNAATGKVSAPAYTLDNGTVTATTVGGALSNLDGRTTTNTSNIANVQAQANKGFNISAAGGTANNVQLGKTVDFTNTDGNLVATASGNGINYNLAENIDLGTTGSLKTGNTVTNNAGVRIDDGMDNITAVTATGTNVTNGVNTSNYGANGLTIVGGPSVTTAGINAGNQAITNLADGVAATDAATKGQVDAVSNGLTDLTAGAVQYDRNNGNINYDNVIFAGTQAVIDQDEDGNDFVVSGGTRLSNVANGINAADAVNKGQLDGMIAQNVTNVEVNDQNGNPITVNITDQVVNRNKDNGNMDSLFLTYNVEGQNVTDHLTISETVQKMNTEGVKFAHTNAVNTKGNLGMTNDSSAGGINSTAIGVNAIVEAFADNTVALGHNTLATNMAKDSVVIGNSSQVAGESSIAIGNGAKALGNQSISIGTGNIVNGDNSGAFGDPSIINGSNSYSVGNNNTINSDDTFVLGNNVTSTIGGSVVLGTGSAARTGAGVVGYLAAGNAAITATTSTTGAVAVGDAASGVYRQVTGVAAGTADSDAVNVSQLKAVSDTLQNNNAALSNAAVQYDKNADGTINKGSITLGGGAAGTTITNVAAGNVSAGSTDAVNGSQLHNLGNGVASIVGGDATFDAAGNLTASNIGGTGKGNISDAIAAVNQGNVQANENIKANTDRLDAGLSFGADSGTTINKPVGDTTALKFEGGNNITTTTTSSGIKFDLNGNIDVDNITADTVTTGNTTVNNNGVTIKDGPSMTTEGINAGGKTITGVADGIKVNDAVNLGQLTALDNKLSNSVNELGYKINEVEDDANAGISAAMAMSSLPQAYIPGKSMIGGGVATYNGQSAVAIGVSKVSDNGRWVIKANGTADTQGNAGGAIGAGFHF